MKEPWIQKFLSLVHGIDEILTQILQSRMSKSVRYLQSNSLKHEEHFFELLSH